MRSRRSRPSASTPPSTPAAMALSSYPGFCALLIAQLAWSDYGVSGAWEALPVFAFVHGVAVALQSWIAGTRSFERRALPDEMERGREEDAGFFFCGRRILPDGLESPIRAEPGGGRLAMLARVAGALAIGGLAITLARNAGVSSKGSLFLATIQATGIVFSASLGHLLIPAAFGWLAAIKAGQAGGAYWAVHVALLAALLVLYRKVELELRGAVRIERKEVLLRALHASAVGLVLAWTADALVPEPREGGVRGKVAQTPRRPVEARVLEHAQRFNVALGARLRPEPSPVPTSAPVVTSAQVERVARALEASKPIEVSESAQKLAMELAALSARSAGRTSAQGAPTGTSTEERERAVAAIGDFRRALGTQPGAGMDPAKWRELLDALERVSRSIELGGTSGPNVEELARLGEALRAHSERLTKDAAVRQELAREIRRIVPPEMPDRPLSQAEADAVRTRLEALAGAQAQGGTGARPIGGDGASSSVPAELPVEARETLAQLQRLQGASASPPSAVPQAPQVQIAATSPAAPTPAKSEAPRELISNDRLEAIVKSLAVLVKAIVVSGVILLVLSWLARLLRRPAPVDGAQPPPRMTREQRRALRDELRALEQARLSAREEVIRKYALFLRIMEQAGHPRPPSLPPSEFAVEIQRKFSGIGKPARGITDCFSDAYYGEESVAASRLAEFRAHLERVIAQVR